MTDAFALQAHKPLPIGKVGEYLEALPTARREGWQDATYMVAEPPELLQSALEPDCERSPMSASDEQVWAWRPKVT